MGYLVHYGVKGQKWGIRRYENKDGTLTAEGKEHYRQSRDRAYALKTHDDVERIFGSFSKKDKKLLDAGEDDKEYMDYESTAYWVSKRFLAKEGDIPVGFLDIIKGQNGEANIAIGTDANYRGKGYASALAKQGADWIDSHPDVFSKVNWGAFKENEASIRLARKNGFELDRDDGNFAVYSKKGVKQHA